MKDDLRQRVQALLDEGAGLSDDALNQALDAAGAPAREEAEKLAAVDAGLRSWPEVGFSDDAAEAIATRIEQRLDEDLARIPDPVAPPIFGDNDGQPPKPSVATPKNPKAPGRTSSGEYSLANLTSLSVKDGPSLRPDAPLKRPEKPAPAASTEDVLAAEDLGMEEVPESGRPLPPPTPMRPLPKTNDRASIPSVEPFGFGDATADVRDLPPPPADLEARRKRNRMIFYWGSGLAAAAAFLVVVVAGISSVSYEAEPVVSMAESTQVAPAEMAEPMEAPGAPQSRGGAYAGSAAADTAAVVEPAAEEMEAEAEPAPEPTTTTAEVRARSESAARPRGTREASDAPRVRRSTAMAASPPAMSTASGTAGSPSRDDVVRAMRAIQPQVAACASTRRGVVNVNITVGGSGRVRNAAIEGEFAGTREGSCVARAVRRARLPEFQRDSFTFRYPFQL